jgi:hypothetical protein
LKYPTSEKLDEKFIEYKGQRSGDMPLTMESFFVFAGFYDASALQTYINDKNNIEFSHTIKKIEAEILSSKIDHGYSGKSTAFSIFDLKVNYKWVEEKIVVVKDETSLINRMDKAKGRVDESK